MAYGLSTRAFIEDGPVEQVARAEAEPLDRPLLAGAERSLPARGRSSSALAPANDRIDGYPLAL